MYYDVIRITANNLYERISRIKYAAEKNFFPLRKGRKKTLIMNSIGTPEPDDIFITSIRHKNISERGIPLNIIILTH